MLPSTWSATRCDHQRGTKAAPIQPPTITTATTIAVYASHRFQERPGGRGGADGTGCVSVIAEAEDIAGRGTASH